MMNSWFFRICSRGHRHALRRALQLRADGDYEYAILEYARILKSDPSFAPAYYGRGYCFSQKHQYREAAADFGIGIKLNPTLRSEYDRYIELSQVYADTQRSFSRESVTNAIAEKFLPELRNEILMVLDAVYTWPQENCFNVEQIQLAAVKLSDERGRFIIEGDFGRMDWRDLISAAWH